MSSVLCLRQSEYSVVWLPIEPPVNATMPAAEEPTNDPVCSNEVSSSTRDPRAMPRFLVAFCVGVIAVLAWQSCSDAARQLAETSSLHFVGLAPIERNAPDMIAPAALAASPVGNQHLAAQENVDQRAASEQKISLPVRQLGSAQEQITGDFDSLQQIERRTISKISVPLPRPVPAETRKYAWRSATTTAGAGPSTHHALISSTSFGSSSRASVMSMRLDTTSRKRTRSWPAPLRGAAPQPFGQSLISASQRLMLALSKITRVQL
jgi:hypothetical protein